LRAAKSSSPSSRQRKARGKGLPLLCLREGEAEREREREKRQRADREVAGDTCTPLLLLAVEINAPVQRMLGCKSTTVVRNRESSSSRSAITKYVSLSASFPRQALPLVLRVGDVVSYNTCSGESAAPQLSPHFVSWFHSAGSARYRKHPDQTNLPLS